MSAVIGALRADLGANIAQFQSDLGKAADSLKSFAKVAKDVGSQCEEIGKQMSIAFTLPLALLGTESVKAATAAAQAMASLKATMASTGNASGKTADQLEDSAKQLRSISTFDAADILKNVTTNLLRFGNVQGPVFDRAQKSIVNLSAALGGDLQSNTIKIGRALNDPIQGVTALTRIGVQFTQQQKDQIKALVESGQGLQAQGIILDTLEQKYGGAAQALRDATPGQDLKDAWEDFSETIGKDLIPILQDLMDILVPLLNAFTAMPKWLQETVIVFATFTAVIGPLLTSFGFLLKLFALLAPLAAPVIAAFAAIDLLAAGLTLALFALVAAIVVYGDAINDVFEGKFSKAVTDAKLASSKIAGFFKSAFTGGAPETPAAGAPAGALPKLNFNTGPDQAKATKELGSNIDSMNAKIAKSLGGLVDDKATADANALNAEIDAFVKKAQEAGVNTKAFADRIAGLRDQIALLKQQGLAKEAQQFGEQVNADQLAVDKFSKGGLPALQEKLQNVDDQYKQLHDKITDQITQNAVLANSNADAAASMDKLKTMLAALEIAHQKATLAAQNQYAAEQGIAHLQSLAGSDAARNAITSMQQNNGTTGPLTSGQAALQSATQDLEDQLVAAETKYDQLVMERQQLESTGTEEQLKDLDTQIALQKQLADLVGGTTADQLVKTKALNDAFKTFTDTVSTDLTNMIVNWSGNLNDLGKAFQQMLAQAFLKPVMDDLVGGLSSVLKGAVSGGAGGGGLLSGVGGFLSSTFGGWFAKGGSLNPGEWGIAGENGPEPIYGGTSGLNVVPAQGGTQGRSIYVDARGATEGTAAMIQSALAQVLPGTVKTAVKQAGQNVPQQMATANKRIF